MQKALGKKKYTGKVIVVLPQTKCPLNYSQAKNKLGQNSAEAAN
jgi:hypothetical protein